jgi:hypothetical protein
MVTRQAEKKQEMTRPALTAIPVHVGFLTGDEHSGVCKGAPFGNQPNLFELVYEPALRPFWRRSLGEIC